MHKLFCDGCGNEIPRVKNKAGEYQFGDGETRQVRLDVGIACSVRWELCASCTRRAVDILADAFPASPRAEWEPKVRHYLDDAAKPPA